MQKTYYSLQFDITLYKNQWTHHNHNNEHLLVAYLPCVLFFFFSPKDIFTDFRERNIDLVPLWNALTRDPTHNLLV